MHSRNSHILNWIVHQLGLANLSKPFRQLELFNKNKIVSGPTIRNYRLQSTSTRVKLDQSKSIKEETQQQPQRVCPISGATEKRHNNQQTYSIQQVSLKELKINGNQQGQQHKQQNVLSQSYQATGNTGEEYKNNNEKDLPVEQQAEQAQVTEQKSLARKETLPFEAIPGPKPSLPYIGTQWIYFPVVGYYKPMKLHEANLDKYRRYGPIMKEEYRGHSTVTIFDPSDMKEVFMRESACPSRPVLPFVIKHRQSDPERYPNVGLANMQGAEWFDLRSNLAPLLLSRELKRRYISTQNRVSNHLVNFIRNNIFSSPASRNNNFMDNDDEEQDKMSSRVNVGGIVENLQEVCYRFSIESIMKLCINQELGCLGVATNSDISGSGSCINNNRIEEISQDVEEIFQAAMKFFEAQHKLSYGLGLFKYIDAKPYRQLCDSQNAIHDIASKYIDVALDNLKQRHSNDDISTHKDNYINPKKTMNNSTTDDHLLDDDDDEHNNYIIDDSEHESLLETLYCTKKFTDLEIKSTIVDFISGGIYLVANTLTMVLFLLASNPSVQEKLYQEICEVFQSETNFNYNNDKLDSDINIDMDKLNQLKYLKLCLKESYRLLPTVPGVARTLQRDMILSNYLVPKNTTVFCNFMVTCRLAEYFTNPDDYNPNRWERSETSDNNNNKGNDLAFSLLPFGHGVSKCIGHNFAEMEIYVAIVKLIRNFKVRTINNENLNSLSLCYRFIVVPEKPVTLEFIPRDQ